MSNKIVIAIDGPSASGKGTIAQMIAKHYDLPYLNTGALYRKLAYDALNLGLDLYDDEKSIVELIGKMDLSDLESKDIHNEDIGKSASIIAQNKSIRSALLYLQKDFANQKKGAVLDGRDIGTVICPDTKYKFFITASLEQRANRRYLQSVKNISGVSKDDIFRQLQERDLRDKGRSNSPLLVSKDAIEIDTSDLSIDQVFKMVLNEIN
jgi:cytidylate kinase